MNTVYHTYSYGYLAFCRNFIEWSNFNRNLIKNTIFRLFKIEHILYSIRINPSIVQPIEKK
jgi:hypothetical protein